MSDFYKMFETPFDRAVEHSIAEINQTFLSDPEAMHEAVEAGERWRALHRASEAAGKHGVVLPMALAEEILALLEGGDGPLSRFNPTLPPRMLKAAINQARGPQA